MVRGLGCQTVEAALALIPALAEQAMHCANLAQWHCQWRATQLVRFMQTDFAAVAETSGQPLMVTVAGCTKKVDGDACNSNGECCNGSCNGQNQCECVTVLSACKQFQGAGVSGSTLPGWQLLPLARATRCRGQHASELSGWTRITVTHSYITSGAITWHVERHCQVGTTTLKALQWRLS